MDFNKCTKMYGMSKESRKKHSDGKNKIANDELKIFGQPTELEEHNVNHTMKFEEMFIGFLFFIIMMLW